MIVRNEQLREFEKAARAAFEQELCRHMEQFSPGQAEALGPERLRVVVVEGIKRADNYGFTNRGPVRFYLEMMFLFGSGFDTDPQYPWAAAMLNDAATQHQMQLATRLHEAAAGYLDRVAGPDRKLIFAAMDRLGSLRLEQFVSFSGLEEAVLRAMQNAYPEKFAYVGIGPLRQLYGLSLQAAEKVEMNLPKGVAVLTGLMFAAGHTVLVDPLYSWAIQPVLAEESTPAERVERVYRRALAFLRGMRERRERRLKASEGQAKV
jgi:hypothetical protein